MPHDAPDLGAFLPVVTDRLTVRMLGRDDVATFTAYRNDPDVARLQEWDLPYPAAAARDLVADQAGLDGPRPGRWVQLAIDDGTGLVGDVAVGLDRSGSVATVGYTLDPRVHGRGFATEAVDAVVGRLFERGAHRVEASLDPENFASMRVLERVGFRWEGRTRSSYPVRGTWADDDRWALLAADHADWRGRPLGRPGSVRLVEVAPGRGRDALGLDVHRSQRRFVASVAESFADAIAPELVEGTAMRPWIRLIEADDELVGFVMVAEPIPAEPVAWLWRLVVDRRHQGRGIGRDAVELVCAHVRSTGADRIRTSWVEGRGGPGPFHRSNGFVPTGEVDDGEVVAERRLD